MTQVISADARDLFLLPSFITVKKKGISWATSKNKRQGWGEWRGEINLRTLGIYTTHGHRH